MKKSPAKWIWIDKETYPGYQEGYYTCFSDKKEEIPYFAAEFCRKYEFGEKVTEIRMDICADTKYHLYLNGEFVGTGPVCPGGDYGFDGRMPWRYYNHYVIHPDAEELSFYCLVEGIPQVQCDMSDGVCGLIVKAEVYFESGRYETLGTDESWSGRLDVTRPALCETDRRISRHEWLPAQEVVFERSVKSSPLENLEEEDIIPGGFEETVIGGGETKELSFELERIYAGFFCCQVEAQGEYRIVFSGYEKDFHYTSCETFCGKKDETFRALRMTSLGGFCVRAENLGRKPLKIRKISYIFTHYPCPENGIFHCSEDLLNRIYDTGKWAVKICKQTLELDSPMHQENLGCTGDYLISSLMNYVTYGNPDVTRFDIVRTADYLKMTGGKMFHTTYSMLWVQMLYDYYMFTGDGSIYGETADALHILMDRFHGYMGENGLIDTPPNYVFVDWLMVDGYSMHRPPKAMGQSVMNAFYTGALVTAAKIENELGGTEGKKRAKEYLENAESVKKAFRNLLFDDEKGLYFDGLNDEYAPGPFLPENSQKRYFSWHTNVLAVLYGICEGEEAVRIMERILGDMEMTNPQPYFMHFVLEAIVKAGLFEKYGLEQIRRWRVMTDFPKGLQEGWYAPGTYQFDYSHVWGGTPTYQLPVRLAGLKILEAGFGKVRLEPKLCGLDWAKVKIPTPLGMIEVEMEKGKAAVVKVPEGMVVV